MMRALLIIFCAVLISGIASAQTVILQPSQTPAIGIIPAVTSTLTSSLIIKSVPGNLYSVVVTGQTAGFLMLFNATTVPGDGAVTPTDCVQVPANSSVSINFAPSPPEVFSSGIVAVLSSTGCLVKTGLNALFIKALAQ